MKRKSKISYEIKLKAVKECISNKKLRSKWCCELDICMNTIKRWIVAYKNSGAKGLKPVVILKRYSKKLKIKAVKEYLNGYAATIREKFPRLLQKVGVLRHIYLISQKYSYYILIRLISFS